MLHTAAIIASFSSLGLICAIYYSNFLSRPGSWLRADISAAIQISFLVGLFPIGLAASVVGLWQALTGGVSLAALMVAGTDVLSFAASIATMLLFRETVRKTYRLPTDPTRVSPIATAQKAKPAFKKAA